MVVGRERDSHSSTEALRGGKVGYWSPGADEEWLESRLRGGSEESVMIVMDQRKCRESGPKKWGARASMGSGERQVEIGKAEQSHSIKQ